MKEFEEFFLQTKNRFFSYLVKLTGNRDDAADILQDTYLKMFQHYRNRFSKALLYKIGYNLFIDTKRKNKFSNNIDIESVEWRLASKEDVVKSNLSAERYYIVIRLLGNLPEDERNLISMVSSGDLTYKEIGEIMNLSEQNIKVKVHRVRKKLKEMMRKEGLI